MEKMKSIQDLENENIELKRALAFLLNKELVKRLSDSLERINRGEYVSEEEFFKDSL